MKKQGEYLAGNQPEPEDARPLLRAMLARAFFMLEIVKQHHTLQKIGYRRWEIGGQGEGEREREREGRAEG